MSRAIANELKRIASPGDLTPGNLLERVFRRFRFSRRPRTTIEQEAARNRVERLFEVNFRNTWTR